MGESAVPDNRHQLKKWVTSLLTISCITSVFLFFSYSPEDQKRFRTATEIDSLITHNFNRFNINNSQVRSFTVNIDSIRLRRIFNVRVPPGFSKTQWHYELDKQLRPYRVSTPARVIFPEQHLRIHITYGPNIVRTIQMQTDPGLVLYRDFVSLILVFDSPPSNNILNRIKAFGEPIQLAIRSDSPRNDFESIRDLRRDYPHTVWLPVNRSGQNFDSVSEMENYLNRLNLIDQIDSGARILFFNPFDEITDTFKERMKRLNLLLVDVSESIKIDDLTDDRIVEIGKQKMLQQSSLTLPPVVMVEGTNTNINVIQEFISTVKQDHVQLRSPYYITL
jgi:hypothetical protein